MSFSRTWRNVAAKFPEHWSPFKETGSLPEPALFSTVNGAATAEAAKAANAKRLQRYFLEKYDILTPKKANQAPDYEISRCLKSVTI